MKYHVVADLHGNGELVEKLVGFVWSERFSEDDFLVLNGDITGWQGPKMAQAVDLFYRVREGKKTVGELEDYLSELAEEPVTADVSTLMNVDNSGIFLWDLAQDYPMLEKLIWHEQKEIYREVIGPIASAVREKTGDSGRIFYLSGNNENATVTDNDISDGVFFNGRMIPFSRRFYHRMMLSGAMWEVHYVENWAGHGKILFLGTNLLMQGDGIEERYLLEKSISTVVVHYPPVMTSEMEAQFPFRVMVSRAHCPRAMETCKKIIEQVHMTGNPEVRVVFGHFHQAVTEEGLRGLPEMLEFSTELFPGMGWSEKLVWLRPGYVYSVA